MFLALPGSPERVPPTTQFRSTWIVSSQNALRERGLFDRYVANLPPELAESLPMTMVGGWVPIDTAYAHYAACDALGLTPTEQLDIGQAVTKHLNQTLLATAVRLAAHSGATVWTPLAQVGRLWERMFVGGAVAVYKLGPKEARIEVHNCTLAPLGYFRTGLEGVLLAIGQLFCQKIYVNEVPRLRARAGIVFRASWV